jgi:hypothetical protein
MNHLWIRAQRDPDRAETYVGHVKVAEEAMPGESLPDVLRRIAHRLVTNHGASHEMAITVKTLARPAEPSRALRELLDEDEPAPEDIDLATAHAVGFNPGCCGKCNGECDHAHN